MAQVVFQTPTGNLYAECGYCDGGGKMIRYTATSDYPGSRKGTPTRQMCGHCLGKRYDKSEPVTIKKAKD